MRAQTVTFLMRRAVTLASPLTAHHPVLAMPPASSTAGIVPIEPGIDR